MILYRTIAPPQFNWNVSRDTTEAKISGLCDSVEEFEEEMQHRFRVSKIKNPIIKYTWDKMEFLQDFSFLLAVIINLLILTAYGVSKSTAELSTNGAPGYAAGLRCGRRRHLRLFLWLLCRFGALVEHTVVGNAPLGSTATRIAINSLGAVQTATSSLVLFLFFVNFGAIRLRRLYVSFRVWLSLWKTVIAVRVLCCAGGRTSAPITSGAS